jgi:hypothetical protein
MTLADWKDLSSVLQSLTTAVGIVVGGLWTYCLFVRNRLSKPHAEVRHTVAIRHLNHDRLLIHVAIEVRNESPILMRITSGKVRLYSMLPLASELKKSLESGGELPERGNDEINWPYEERDFHWEGEKNWHEIEPQESDQFDFDFIAPRSLRTFQIYSYVKNVAKPNKEIGWNTQTIHDVE